MDFQDNSLQKSDSSAAESKSIAHAGEEPQLTEPSYKSALELIPYHHICTVSKIRKLDFELMYDSFLCEQAGVKEALREIFDMYGLDMIQDTIFSEIAFFAQPIITGYWYTTGKVYLHQQKNGLIVGKFADHHIIGKSFSSHDFILHQYLHDGSKLTLWLRPDKEHLNLEGPYWREWNAENVCNITLRRTPDLYQRALDYASSGDIDRLAELLDEKGFDIDTQKKEMEMFTVLHKAIVRRQVAVVQFLLTRGADLTIKNRYGEDAFRMAGRCSNLAKRMKFDEGNQIEHLIKEELLKCGQLSTYFQD